MRGRWRFETGVLALWHSKSLASGAGENRPTGKSWCWRPADYILPAFLPTWEGTCRILGVSSMRHNVCFLLFFLFVKIVGIHGQTQMSAPSIISPETLTAILATADYIPIALQFSSVQLLSHVRLFATSWIAARQASLSITNSQSSLRLTSIQSVMPSSHLILCRPRLLLPPTPRHRSLLPRVNSSHEVAKVLEFQL